MNTFSHVTAADDAPASFSKLGETAAASLIQRIGPLNAIDPAPLYIQLQRRLRQVVTGKLMQPGDALPPERDIADAMKLSRITVRKAINALVDAGLLTRRRGAGTFISEVDVRRPSRLTSFSEDMASRGRSVTSVWLTRSDGIVTPEEALSLNLSPGAPVLRFHRLRYADDQIAALEFTSLPKYCLPSADVVTESLYAAMNAHGTRPVRALQRLRAINLSQEHAVLMNVTPGAAALFIERRGFLDDGRPAELTHSYYLGGAYDIVAELGQ